MTVAIVLDFDNCVALDPVTGTGSEELKQEAWLSIFAASDPKLVRARLSGLLEQLAGGGGDRADIAKDLCSVFSYPRPAATPEETVERCLCHYEQLINAGIAELTIDRDSLYKLSAARPVFLNTATPMSAIHQVLRSLDLETVFAGIKARPSTKFENLQAIAAEVGAQPSELLFVDDQPSGWAVAEQFGCRFVGIRTSRVTAWHADSHLPFPVIARLDELLHHL